MNRHFLKIIEQLGYTYEFKQSINGRQSLIIYDENHQALTKEFVNDEIYCGMRYKGKSGNVIHFDNSGVLFIKVGDNITIKGENLFNHIIVYYRLDESTDYALSFFIESANSYAPKGAILVCTWKSYKYKNDYGLKINIDLSTNKATISNDYDPIESFAIENDSTSNYYRTIVDFIRKYVEKDTEVEIEKGFSLVSPAVISMIDSLVNENEYNYYNDNSRRK